MLPGNVKPPRLHSSWDQHGAHLGPVGPRWAPCWPHEPCYQGWLNDICMDDCDWPSASKVTLKGVGWYKSTDACEANQKNMCQFIPQYPVELMMQHENDTICICWLPYTCCTHHNEGSVSLGNLTIGGGEEITRSICFLDIFCSLKTFFHKSFRVIGDTFIHVCTNININQQTATHILIMTSSNLW